MWTPFVRKAKRLPRVMGISAFATPRFLARFLRNLKSKSSPLNVSTMGYPSMMRRVSSMSCLSVSNWMTSSAPGTSVTISPVFRSSNMMTFLRPSEPAKATVIIGSMASSALGILFWTLGLTSMSTATRLMLGMGAWRSLAHSSMGSLNLSSVLMSTSLNCFSISGVRLQSSATRLPSTILYGIPGTSPWS